MPDMLVNLLNLPDFQDEIERLAVEGIKIQRVQPFDASVLRKWVSENFNEGWADEVMVAFSHQPVTCFVAALERRIIGFAAYECTRKNFFGPTGVQEEYRGKGIGRALLLTSLHSMREMGYAYAIIGGVGPKEFYKKNAGAILIPRSTPGIFGDWLERT